MKVKKFDNIWTMGLILFGAFLIGFYIAKLFFPEWIIGVAETPQIVEIGNFIDSNIYVYHIFEIAWSTFIFSIYACACCRTKYLKAREILLIIMIEVALQLVFQYFSQYYFISNILFLIVCPLLISIIRGNFRFRVLVSLVVCFVVDCLSQILSLQIRDITLLANTINTATLIILTIDVVIWRALLYCYFNFTKEIKNG